MKCIIVLLTFVGYIQCKVPDYVKPCAKNSDLSSCLMANYKSVTEYLAKNGEPAFKVPNLQKFVVPKIAMQATKELQVSLNDIEFTGLDKFDVNEMSMTDSELHIKGFLPRLEYLGMYDMKGKILILPIEGQGTMNITQVDVVMDYTAKLKVEERKGKKYYYVANDWEDTKLTVVKVKKIIWHFDNLFGGDPRLGPEMNKFLNENWEDVYNEVKGALEQGAAFSLFNLFINGYLRHIPIDELFAN